MSLDIAVKKKIMTEYATSEGDTGSPEVQVALLTQRIKDLTEHSREQGKRGEYRRMRGDAQGAGESWFHRACVWNHSGKARGMAPCITGWEWNLWRRHV